tara:strand:- start:2282 stop:3862 length:1581 start_codon:yes stop_codon:yes gene_type:complete
MWGVGMIRLILLCLVAFLSLGCSDNLIYKVQESRPEIVVYPEEIDFGHLRSGYESGKQEIIIVNTGDGDLVLASPELFDGSNRFGINYEEDLILESSELFVIDVFYTPETHEFNGSFIRIESNDEDTPVIDVNAIGVGDAPIMDVSPVDFDYGDITIGCDNEERITIKNTGNMTLIVDSIIQMVTQPSDIYMEFGSLPEPPWDIVPGASLDFLVSYIPTNVGNDESEITINGNDPLTPSVETSQYGAGDVEMWFIETHIQESIPILDIIWVVDDSGSMNRFQNSLASNIGLFVNTFMATGADYRMSVITTSNSIPSPMITNFDADPAGTLASYVMVGVQGAGMEKGIQMAERALSSASALGPGSSFFREAATLVVIYVSDEPDHSDGGWASYLSFFDGIKPHGQFIPYGVIGDYPGGCTSSSYGGAQFGAGYWDMIDYYGGAWYSICATDWGVQLQNMANALSAKRAYELNESDPIEETIAVYVNGQLTSHWEYDGNTNNVIFHEDYIPEEGQTIEIEYAVWGCYE